MRVLLVDSIGHLLDRHDVAIATALVERGVAVTLATNDLAPPLPGAAPFPREIVFRRIVGDVGRLRKTWNYLRAGRALVDLARRHDVVCWYYILQPEFDRWLIRRLERAGIPVLLVAHDVLPLHWDADRRQAYARIYRSASRLMVMSHFAKQRLANQFRIPEERIGVAHLGAAPLEPQERVGKAAAREHLGIPAQEQTLLCFGQIKRNKDLPTLIRAFAEIAARFPSAHLRIVGRPWHRTLDLERRLVDQLALGPRVTFFDQWVDAAVVPKWFEAADLVVIAYSHLYQSDVLVRAATHRCAVVATAVGSNPEVIAPGRTGWLVPPSDDAAMASTLAEVLGNPTQGERRGRALESFILESASWGRFADKARVDLELTRHRSR